jgi:cation diffusion facilitator family transporter
MSGMADEQTQHGGSFLTVLIALVANVAIAAAKSVAALLTGSASMTAEAAHSWADAGNEVLLLIAERRGRKAPDRSHPYGYGKDVYVWSLFAAFGLFTVGALVAYIVLGISFLLEGISFLRSVKQLRGSAAAADQDVLEHVLATSDPTVRAVFFEDAAALIGLVLAAAGIVLHQVTGSAFWDALGSILIGCLLGAVAVVLIQLNRRFLIGQSPSPRVMEAVLKLLADQDDVASVSYLHLEYVGPARVFLVAAVDLVGDAPEHEIANRLSALGRAVEEDEHVVEAVLTLSRPDAPPLPVSTDALSTRLPR